MEIEEQPLSVVLAEEEEGACEHQNQLCQQCWPQAASVTALSAFTSPPLGKDLLFCTTNKLWPLASHSMLIFLKAYSFYLISVLLTPLLLTTSQRKYTFSVINSNCHGCIAEPFFHTLFIFFFWNQIPFLFNPFKFRIWCRFLIRVIFFPANSFGYILMGTVILLHWEHVDLEKH